MDEINISPARPGADRALLDLALTHPSISRELGGDPLACNERLEFLGDAVVQLCTSDYIYRTLTDRDEGGLTTTRSFVVRGVSLARAAEALHMGDALALSRGANAAGGRKRSSVLGSLYEAVIGAVYLDGGWEAACRVISATLVDEMRDALAQRRHNGKGELQEYTQDKFGPTPIYRTVGVSGPPHDRHFEVEVSLGDRVLAKGQGSSKKAAEQQAAAAALERLKSEAGEGADSSSATLDHHGDSKHPVN